MPDWFLIAFALVGPLVGVFFMGSVFRDVLKDPTKEASDYPRLNIIATGLLFVGTLTGAIFIYHVVFLVPLLNLSLKHFDENYLPLYVGVIVASFSVGVPIGLFLGFQRLIKWWRGLSPDTAIVPTPTPEPPPASDTAVTILSALTIPTALIPPVLAAVTRYTASTTPEKMAEEVATKDITATISRSINILADYLPAADLITTGRGQTWGQYLSDLQTAHAGDKSKLNWLHHMANAQYLLPNSLLADLNAIEIGIQIPDKLRTEHALVIAGSGFGKSQLFQTMILADKETDAALIVIDSQNDLINKLATRLHDPLVIDPIACPPALNVFKLGDPGLLEYVFGALDAKMTSKQSMVYRFICRYIIKQDGTVSDLLRILQQPAQEYETDNEAAAAFFAEYKNPKGEYRDTRQEIMRRLLTLMENDAFNLMLSAADLKIDIAQAIDEGRTVLINTAKADTGNAGAALFGRFWLALVLQAVMKGARKRVNLYVDEFADYASDDLEMFFTQARKYNLAMTCAFQNTAQLPDRLRAAMMTSTSIKLVGGLSAEDRSNLARQMDCEPDFIAKAKKGTFAAWFRDMGTVYYTVEFGRLEAMPEVSRLDDIYAEMRAKYGPAPQTTPPEQKPQVKSEKSFMVDDE